MEMIRYNDTILIIYFALVRRSESGAGGGSRPQVLFAQLLSGAARRATPGVKSVLTPLTHTG
jgi:hypothetical protein